MGEPQENKPEVAITLEPNDLKPATEPVKKPTYITDFPPCVSRFGRVFSEIPENGIPEANTVPTCGFREVTLAECLDCTCPHDTDATKIHNGKKLVKHGADIRELQQKLAIAETEIRDLKEILVILVSQIQEQPQKQIIIPKPLQPLMAEIQMTLVENAKIGVQS